MLRYYMHDTSDDGLITVHMAHIRFLIFPHSYACITNTHTPFPPIQDAYREAEAELFGSAKSRAKKRRKGSTTADGDSDEEDAFFRSLAAQDKIPKYVELLKFKNLNPGMKLWASVADIFPKELILNLPHGLRAHVPYPQASDMLTSSTATATTTPLSSLFHVGQLVRCVITNIQHGSGDDDNKNKHNDAAADDVETKNKTKSKKKKKKKRVEASLHVSKINSGLSIDSVRPGCVLPACVKSVEDHGYVLSFGIRGTTGFLPKKDLKVNHPLSLVEGSLVDVGVVAAVGEGGSGHVLVTAAPSVTATTPTAEWEGLNIGTLLPGALVTAKVRNVLSDGLLVSFLTFFTGTIDPFHLDDIRRTSAAKGKKKTNSIQDVYAEGQKLKARILYVDVATKRVGLTLLRSLLDSRFVGGEEQGAVGTLFPTSIVKRIDPGLGVLLELHADGGERCDGETTETKTKTAPPTPLYGYAHISNVSDDTTKIKALESHFKLGQVVAARCMGSRPMDDLLVVSLKPSVVAQSFLNLSDITPGMSVSGTVMRSDPGVVLVALTSHLTAVVPPLHQSDVVTAKAYRKFKEGQSVRGRVLVVDHAAKKVVVTLKPSLVDSKLPVVASCGDDVAVPGTKAHGVITGVQKSGIFVTFYNNVSGFVPLSECGLPLEGQSIEEAFDVGTVVRVRIVGTDTKRNGRLKLSLVSKKKAKAAVEEALGVGLDPGTIVRGKVVALHYYSGGSGSGEQGQDQEKKVAAAEEEAEKKFKYAEVALFTSKEDEDDSKAPIGRLELHHLSDHPLAAQSIAEALVVGSRLERLLVLQRLETAKQLRVTRKTSLINAVSAATSTGKEEEESASSLPSQFSSLKEGRVYPGYVASVAADGVFVRFLGDLTGRSGLAQLSDTFVSSPASVFYPGQSVRAQVTQINTAKAQFNLSLKYSLTAAADTRDHVGLLKAFFQDVDVAAALLLQANKTQQREDKEETELEALDWSRVFAIGSVVQGQVHGVREYGVLCDLDPHSDVVGVVVPEQMPEGVSTAEGTPISAVVLDYTKNEGIVDLSLALAQVDEGGEEGEGERVKKRAKKGKGKEGGEEKKQATRAAVAGTGTKRKVGDAVSVAIELVKQDEGYVVVSLSDRSIGFLATTATFNLNPSSLSHVSFKIGERVEGVVVAALPDDKHNPTKRLLLTLPSSVLIPQTPPGSGKNKNAKNQGASKKGDDAAAAAAAAVDAEEKKKKKREERKEKKQKEKELNSKLPKPGTVFVAKIEALHPLHADVVLSAPDAKEEEGSFRGRLHITQILDENTTTTATATTTADGKRRSTRQSSKAAKKVGGEVETDRVSPITTLKVGDSIKVVVVERMQSSEGKKHGIVEVSCRPSALAATTATSSPSPTQLSWTSLQPGQTHRAYVQEVHNGYLWAVLSPTIRGRAFLPGGCCSTVDECRTAASGGTASGGTASGGTAIASTSFTPGAPLDVELTSVDASKHALDFVLAGRSVAKDVIPGQLLPGLVTTVGGGSGVVVVQLAPNLSGRVALTDIHDVAVKNALHGLKSGQFVLAYVLNVTAIAAADEDAEENGDKSEEKKAKKKKNKGKKRKKSDDAEEDGDNDGSHQQHRHSSSRLIELSLRPSRGGKCPAHAIAIAAATETTTATETPTAPPPPPPPDHPLSLPDDIKPGQKIAGYIKASGPNGVFISLSRAVDARIRLRQLSEQFIPDVVSAYPVGQYIEATVLKVEDGKIDLTLRQRKPRPSVASYKEGGVVKGRVKRIEKYGVFVQLEGGAVGLAHVSEVADAFVADVNELFKVGQGVRARVLKVDAVANKLSLGLKPSYFEGEESSEEDEDDEEEGGGGGDFDETLREAAAVDDSDDDATGDSDSDSEDEEDEEGFDLDAALLDVNAEEDSDDGSDDGSEEEEEVSA